MTSTLDNSCTHDIITVTTSSPQETHVTGVYQVQHESSIGVKYINAHKDVKITYSTRVNNIHDGHWRWSKNSPPYTLYYANPSKDPCVPSTGWLDVDSVTFTGEVSTPADDVDVMFNVYRPCEIVFDVYKPCEIVFDVYKPCVSMETPELPPQQFPEIPIPDAPPGIIRHELTEHMWVRAKPTISHVTPTTARVGAARDVKISGLSLQHTTSVYVSGSENTIGMALSSVDMFSHIPSLSAEFPGFSGIPVTYVIQSDNTMTVTLPSTVDSGVLDVIILNKAGYDQMKPTYQNYTQWSDYNLQNKIITII